MKASERNNIEATMTVVVDTREHETDALHRRLRDTGLPCVSEKLSFGDYSARFVQGEARQLPACIERKMSVDELATCFTKDRERFEREMERCKAAGWKMWIIVENASWENIYAGKYRSLIKPVSLVGSILRWSIRYNINFVFCKEESCGTLIGDILRRELREFLIREDKNGGISEGTEI
jgi:ERCC4-type nuclease